MKPLSLFILILLTACAPSFVPPPNTIVTSPPSERRPSPPPSETSSKPTQSPPFAPKPGDDSFVRGSVYLDSIDLLVMESYPPQFTLVLTGSLPTPCNQLRVNVNPPDAQKKIAVDAYSVSKPGAICIQMLQPFSENIPLGSFPSGHYEIWVNGEKAAEFDA